MTKTRAIMGALSASVLTIAVMAGCQNQTIRDLENVPVKDPQKLELYVNVDKFPNVAAICINGQGFVSTTRDNSNAALQQVPEWGQEGGWCKQ